MSDWLRSPTTRRLNSASWVILVGGHGAPVILGQALRRVEIMRGLDVALSNWALRTSTLLGVLARTTGSVCSDLFLPMALPPRSAAMSEKVSWMLLLGR